MGNACCVTARDKMVVPNSSAGENFQRTNVRHSPTWSFRWDNRGRVAGEDSSLSWLSDGISRNDGSEIKLESAFVSSEGSPLNNIRTHTLQKSPGSDLSFPRSSSMKTVLKQKSNVSAEFAAPSYPYPARLSLSLASRPPSFPTSPLSSESFLHSSSSSTLKPPRPHASKQVPDDQIYGVNSLSRSSETEEGRGNPLSYDSSQCGPSDGWSLQAFSEMMSSSSRAEEHLSYENDCFGFQHDKINYHGNRMINHEQQTCGTCCRPLSEKSLWSSQKVFMTNELSVSAILACGHVYHGECLEQMTLEIDKFDPSCPICTLGEKKTMKLSEKALKVEMDLKARHNKRLRNRVLDSDFDCDGFVMFDHSHRTVAASKSPKLLASSSAKSSYAKPFLARHFSFGSRSNSKSHKENPPVKKKGFFWTKSSNI